MEKKDDRGDTTCEQFRAWTGLTGRRQELSQVRVTPAGFLPGKWALKGNNSYVGREDRGSSKEVCSR